MKPMIDALVFESEGEIIMVPQSTLTNLWDEQY